MLKNAQKDFIKRHIGPSEKDQKIMLQKLGYKNLEELISKTVPEKFLLKESLSIADDLFYLLASGHGLDIKDIFDKKDLIKQDIRVETIERVKLCNGWAKEAIPTIVLERTGKPATPEFIEGATRTFGMWWLSSLESIKKERS